MLLLSTSRLRDRAKARARPAVRGSVLLWRPCCDSDINHCVPTVVCHCVSTYQPLYVNHRMSTIVYQSLRIYRCLPTIVHQSLGANHCVPTVVHQPLSIVCQPCLDDAASIAVAVTLYRQLFRRVLSRGGPLFAEAPELMYSYSLLELHAQPDRQSRKTRPSKGISRIILVKC